MRTEWETCSTCQKEMEYELAFVHERRWFVDRVMQKADWEPLEIGDNYFCSAGCRSQYVHDRLSEEDKGALNRIASLVHLHNQLIGVSYESFGLKHAALKQLIDPVVFRTFNLELDEIAKAIGAEDEPKWYLEAIGFIPRVDDRQFELVLKPATAVEFVAQGLGVRA